MAMGLVLGRLREVPIRSCGESCLIILKRESTPRAKLAFEGFLDNFVYSLQMPQGSLLGHAMPFGQNVNNTINHLPVF